MPRIWYWLLISVLVLCDQLSKSKMVLLLQSGPMALLPGLQLQLAYNTGVSFSLGHQLPSWSILVLNAAITLYLVYWLTKLAISQVEKIGLSLVIAGGIGNMIDRTVLGYVIDFIDVYWRNWHWPTFNVADSCISIGVVLLLINLVRNHKEVRELR